MEIKDFKDQMDLKRCLFIENGVFSQEESPLVYDIYEELKDLGVECRVVDRASQNPKDVFEGMKWCDSIFFASTFLYPGEIKGLGDLIKKMEEPKKIFGKVIGGQLESLQHELEGIWSLEEMAGFHPHEIYELEGRKLDLDPQKINLDFYIQEVERAEKERVERNAGFKGTRRWVKIKKIQAFGHEWSLLKEGDVVQELDCSSIDPNPAKGVWVMGRTEPVKLLNSDGYEEWEYDKLSAYDLAREFFARGNKLDTDPLLIDAVGAWINSVGRYSDSQIWEWCDNLCSTIGLERRGNRSYFDRRLKEYRSKYTYFMEFSRTMG